MRTAYKVLTLLVLAGLVCYSGRSLNMEAAEGVKAEQALKSGRKMNYGGTESVKSQQGEVKMSDNMSTNHTWNKTKENLHIAKDNIAEESEKLWDKTKEGSKKAVHEISEETEEIWDKTKETSAEVWDKTKNVSAKTWDKAKNTIHGSKNMQTKAD